MRTRCGVTLEEYAPQGVMVEMASECPDFGGGCALGSEDFSASGLLLAILIVFAASLAARNRRFFGSPGRVP